MHNFQVLSKGAPYPTIVMPPNDGYWIDGVNASYVHLHDDEFLPSSSALDSVQRYKLELDETSRFYRKHFYGKVRKFFGYCSLVWFASDFVVFKTRTVHGPLPDGEGVGEVVVRTKHYKKMKFVDGNL